MPSPKKSKKRKLSTAQPSPLENYGGNFVEASLKVVVRMAKGTIYAFQPDYVHGTSKLFGAHNTGVAITFSQRLLDAYKKSLEGCGTEQIMGETSEVY